MFEPSVVLIRKLVSEVGEITAASPNEASMRASIESVLADHAKEMGIIWSRSTLDRYLRSQLGAARFADVSHGGVVIEYEPPRSFSGGRNVRNVEHARAQAKEYAELIALEEGRSLEHYLVIAWDGDHITFGRWEQASLVWAEITPFDEKSASVLIRALEADGMPLVNPRLLAEVAGPESGAGTGILPILFRAARAAAAGGTTTKTKLLYTEWTRLFGEVVGIQSDNLKALLERQGIAHGEKYAEDPSSYLFALNTYIAILAKITAALSLPTAATILDRRIDLRARFTSLEQGEPFAALGIQNMPSADFFSWYLDDKAWAELAPKLEEVLVALEGLSFNTAKKDSSSLRDLFKGIYMEFAPRELRHALGEFYTEDWLAEYVVDKSLWQPTDSFLDPTAGSGTFLLEALKRRMKDPTFSKASAQELLKGIHGIDLNPLAVLTAKASMIVFLGPRFKESESVVIPVYLADAINVAKAREGYFEHTLQTEKGKLEFAVPKAIVGSSYFFQALRHIGSMVDDGLPEAQLLDYFASIFPEVKGDIRLKQSLKNLVKLHSSGWNGIWASILAERFAAGAIGRVSHIVGNPPWVKWSHLPKEYAEFIKPYCDELGVFSGDTWVGGIEADISTVITYTAVREWLGKDGTLAFLITGTLFSNSSSAGFRKFVLHDEDKDVPMKVLGVEDFKAIAPFEDVSNHTVLLILKRDEVSTWPVPYTVWLPKRRSGRRRERIEAVDQFLMGSDKVDLLAAPVPGTEAGPWLKGSAEDHKVWKKLFSTTDTEPAYRARKGVTSDANGIYFVKPRLTSEGRIIERDGKYAIESDPSEGRRSLPERRGLVEPEAIRPLLRGNGVGRFRATTDKDHYYLVPQTGMHGEKDLGAKMPGAYDYLKGFKEILETRSSYQRFQRAQPYWSLWSVGPYTFSPFKVAWREMSGGRFAAAVVSPVEGVDGSKVAPIPDHKVYFVPCDTQHEAAFIAAVLNAPTVARAIGAYAASLSLGASVVEYLNIPAYNAKNLAHKVVSDIGIKASLAKDTSVAEYTTELDVHVLALFGLTKKGAAKR